jgi:hypothetical protein
MEEGNGVSSAGSRIQEIEERRAKRKESIAKAREEQYAVDLEAVDKLEEELGADRLGVLHTPSFVAGLPTLVVVKTPSSSFFNRFRSMVRKAGQKTVEIGTAKDLLADVCVAYPPDEVYKRMKEEWPSIHDSVGIEAVRLGEAEGKA